MAQKILLVEDDPCFGSVLKSYLELSDYEVTLCVNGNDGLEAFRKDKFDICLLDVMMPEMDGFTLGKKIREIDGNVPFVYITAKSMKEDMKQGYEIGADDYIVKPCSLQELSLRISINIRRQKKIENKSGVLEFTPLKIELIEHRTFYGNEEIALSNREFDVLVFLAKHKGEVVTFEQIGKEILGTYLDSDRKNVMVNVSRLRKKFEGYVGLENMIETVWGKGYRFKG